jgi:hypothetical protein
VFAIGAANRAKGREVASITRLLELLRAHLKQPAAQTSD